MENNIVEKKEGIYYYFKTLFGNTNREKDIDEIIEDDDKINEETKKEWERLQKRIKAMEKEYNIETFEISSRQKTPKIKNAKISKDIVETIEDNKKTKKERKPKQTNQELEI